LDYAKDLSRWSYEGFDAAVRSARRTAGESPDSLGLFDTVRRYEPSVDESQFHDSVSQRLRKGDFLLLIVGDGIREGVGAITQFLEGHGTLHFTFGLVEMAIYRLPDGGLLVQPRMLAQSTIVRRTVIDLAENLAAQERAESEGDAEEVSEALRANRAQFTAFWERFLKELTLDDKSQPPSAPNKSANQFFAMPSGSSAWVSAYVAQSLQRVGVYLTFTKGPLADRLYSRLKDDREEIDAALGVPVDWESDGAKHQVVARKAFPGRLLEDHGDEIRPWLTDHVNRFVTVFRPRLARLVEEEGTATAGS